MYLRLDCTYTIDEQTHSCMKANITPFLERTVQSITSHFIQNSRKQSNP